MEVNRFRIGDESGAPIWDYVLLKEEETRALSLSVMWEYGRGRHLPHQRPDVQAP
jgi:hypothetical protein